MLAALVGLVSPAAAREFRVTDTQAEDYPTVQALTFMARLIEQRTGGRHRIHIFHSRQLGEEKETIEQTRAGAIDLNRTNVAPIGAMIPAANVLALPFLFRSFDHLHQVLDQEIGDEILSGFQRHGFVGLTFYDSGARSIYNSVRPIRSLADMKGLRIRIQQSDLMSKMIRSLGAEPDRTALWAGADRAADQAHRRRGKQLAVLRHHRALQDGPVLHDDGAHDGARGPGHVDARLGEPVGRGSGDLPRRRPRVRASTCASLWLGLERNSRQQARMNGNTIIDNFDRKPFERAMNSIYTNAVMDPELIQLIERIRKVQ